MCLDCPQCQTAAHYNTSSEVGNGSDYSVWLGCGLKTREGAYWVWLVYSACLRRLTVCAGLCQPPGRGRKGIQQRQEQEEEEEGYKRKEEKEKEEVLKPRGFPNRKASWLE